MKAFLFGEKVTSSNSTDNVGSKLAQTVSGPWAIIVTLWKKFFNFLATRRWSSVSWMQLGKKWFFRNSVKNGRPVLVRTQVNFKKRHFSLFLASKWWTYKRLLICIRIFLTSGTGLDQDTTSHATKHELLAQKCENFALKQLIFRQKITILTNFKFDNCATLVLWGNDFLVKTNTKHS